MMARVLVLGIGNRLCGDDAVGPCATDALMRELEGDGTEISVDSAALWEVASGRRDLDLLVLIDAAEARAGWPVGGWRRLSYPRDVEAMEGPPLRLTHNVDIDMLLRLARQMDALPPTVWIYALAGRRFATGERMSPEVARAVVPLAERIRQDIRSWRARNALASAGCAMEA